MRKQKWSDQEQIYLKKLREQKNLVSWKEIAKQMNIKFRKCSKSAKQCRQKYINYTRFYGVQLTEGGIVWKPQDDVTLQKLYEKHGSTWSSFTSNLPNKSQNSIKNRFYNRLKKLSKRMDDHRSEHSQQIRGTSTYQSLVRILDFSNQVKQMSEMSHLVINIQSVLFKARSAILNCCFGRNMQTELGCQELCDLNKKIKEVNIKIRCFGICKSKNRKNWKLSKRGLTSTLQFDNQIFKISPNDNIGQKPTQNINIIPQTQKQPQIAQNQVLPQDKINREVAQNYQMHPYFSYPFFPPPPYNYFMMPPIAPYYNQHYYQNLIKIQEQENYRIISQPGVKRQENQ